MRTTRARWAAVVIGALLSCHGPPPETQRTVTSRLGGPDVAFSLAMTVAKPVLERALEQCGFLDAIGLGGSREPDPWTKQKLEEISTKLDGLQANLDAVHTEMWALADFTEIGNRVTEIGAAYTHIANTCYHDTLRATALSVDLAPDERNAELLARAREIVGLTVPAGLPERCNIRDSLNTIRNALVAPDSIQGPMLTKMARWARSKKTAGKPDPLPFEAVANYFVWAVGTERLAMSLVAEARHRLGQDNDLAADLVDFRQSLREQEIELLRAAEAYGEFVEQCRPPRWPLAPSDLARALGAFEVADLVVAAMEGTPRFVTATLVQGYPTSVPGDPTFNYRVPIAVPPEITVPGGNPVPLGDTLTVADGKQGYGQLNVRSLQAINGDPFKYTYVLPLKPARGIEVGWGTEVQFTRWLTTEVPYEATHFKDGSPGMFVTVSGSGWPEPSRELALALRNAVTLREEGEGVEPTPPGNPRDRQLLAHEDARGLAVSRLKLLASGEDPRRVTLAVDLPSRGLADVPFRAIDDGFAARDGAGDLLTVEIVPLGPAEPERVRVKLGEGRWLGIKAPAESGDFATVVEVATAPDFAFELVRAGDAYEVSWFDAADVRRFLYVNEQFLSAHDGQYAGGASFNFGLNPEVLFWDVSPNGTRGFKLKIRNATQTAVDYQLWYAGSYPPGSGAHCYLLTGGGACWPSEPLPVFPYAWCDTLIDSQVPALRTDAFDCSAPTEIMGLGVAGW